MSAVLLKIEIRSEADLVRIRARAREVCSLLGFDTLDQTRVSTAASEVARNAFQYAGGGAAVFSLEDLPKVSLVVRVIDEGPGIESGDAILDGRRPSKKGLGLGLIGAKKIVDDLKIEARPTGGTIVHLRKHLPVPQKIQPEELQRIREALANMTSENPIEEVRRHNDDLLRTLDELERQKQEVARAHEIIAEKAEFEQQLIGIVSHDLRNPLAAILAATNLLLDFDDLNALQTKTVKRIASSGERAARLIRDLLDFTQARTGNGIPVERSQQNAHSVANSVLEEMRIVNPKRTIAHDRMGNGDCELDPDRIAQALTNLLRNAVQYSSPGTPIYLSSIEQPETIEFRVWNEGPAIPAETCAGLFEPMRRGTENGPAGHQGIGLGLFIVKEIFVGHGGNVHIESLAGKGTTVVATIPRGPAPLP